MKRRPWKRPPIPVAQAAKELEQAHNAVADAALEMVGMVEGNRGPNALKFAYDIVKDAVDEWKAAGQVLHDAQIAAARAS